MIKNKEQSLFKFTGQLGFAGIFSKLISLPHSIVYAKFLMPSGYGILQLINVIISYFGYIQMGILQAVTRNKRLSIYLVIIINILRINIFVDFLFNQQGI